MVTDDQWQRSCDDGPMLTKPPGDVTSPQTVPELHPDEGTDPFLTGEQRERTAACCSQSARAAAPRAAASRGSR
ncbi:hypothetical protein EYF80_036215 [Liparis tanakae]|uniref:Uncharacterized protein n=1 Tax=Liparis tanakae TaxID=230148 RepID=A0A4Z2GLQ4_9TELE|nr:hypothetical protein EYF80_036215 [Liparis tanakae]